MPFSAQLEAAKPQLLSRARPCRELVREQALWLSACPRDGRVVDYMRRLAIHEAAHAVTAAMMSQVEIQFATIKGAEEFAGEVHLHVYRNPRPPAEHLARQSLAGPVAERIAGADPWFEPDGNLDWEDALEEIGDFALLCHVWDETVLLLTRPHVWRKTIKVADALLRKGTLTGTEVYAIARAKDDHREVEGLRETRLRMLSTGVMLL
jgi:hypothetical protein